MIALAQIQQLYAVWIKELGRELSARTVTQQLAGVRHLFDSIVHCHVLPANSAVSVRSPVHSVRRATRRRWTRWRRTLLHAIDVSTPINLRDGGADRAEGLQLRPDWHGARRV